MCVSIRHSLHDETVVSLASSNFTSQILCFLKCSDYVRRQGFWLFQTLIRGKTFANVSILLEGEFDEPLLNIRLNWSLFVIMQISGHHSKRGEEVDSREGYERSKKHFLEINYLICDQIRLVDYNSGLLTGVTQRSLSKWLQF